MAKYSPKGTKKKKKSSSVASKPKLTTNAPTTESTSVPLLVWGDRFWRTYAIAGLILFILPIALYWQCLDFGYVLDDQIVITDNEFTKQGWAGIYDIFTTESFTGYFGEQKNLVQGNRYRPLSIATFAMEYGTWGENPFLSHLINLILYSLVGLLIFRLLSLLLPITKGREWWFSVPFITALLYVLHPIHTEAVANIKGRDEVLSMFFSLATLYYMLKYNDSKKGLHLISAGALFFLGLLSKENAVTFLAVIPLTFYFFTSTSLLKALQRTLPLLGVFALYVGVRIAAAGVPDLGKEIPDLMNNPFLGMGVGEKLATISFTLLKYIQLFLFPHPLSHDYYPYAIPKLSFFTWQAALSVLVYISLIVWAVRSWKSKSVASYGLWFYFITLSIVSNVVVNLGTFMNERFIFMASLGLTLVLAHLLINKLSHWKGNVGKYMSIAILALLCIGYSVKTWERVPDWESAMTLNRSATNHGTNSARANSFMATALYEEARDMVQSPEKERMLEEAYTFAKKAVNIHPRYGAGNLMLSGISAELYKKHRDQTRLLSDFTIVAKHRPDTGYLTEYADYLESRTSDLDELVVWYKKTGLGVLQDAKIHPKWAVHWLLRAHKFRKNDKDILKGLADGYSRLGDTTNSRRFSNLYQSM